VYRLAGELGLAGWVLNSAQGVSIEVEGPEERLDQFRHRLESEKPAAAGIRQLDVSYLEQARFSGFEIRDSIASGAKTALILPDIATCEDCLGEILDPANRRFRYPFTNCTHCGPRFSIVEDLPYDRQNTSMKGFTMCPDCEREYHDPNDRRFHAQPNACPKCGPQLELWDTNGNCLGNREDALRLSAEAVLAAQILALKGIGGFQLIVDARNEAAVHRLRERKHRPDKPFAVMFPVLRAVEEHCQATSVEKDLLLSPQSPIALLERRPVSFQSGAVLAASIAPGNRCLGVMLPYSPLHHLLLRALETPVVATSGNLSDEPICIDEGEALERLRGIADLFLVHNRPIVRHMDDSVLQVVMGREMILRCGRGYAPMAFSRSDPRPALAVGAQLKAAVAVGVGQQILLGQHIGDLETSQAFTAFTKSAADLRRLYEIKPEVTACDLHPDYLSTKFVRHHESENGSEDASNCVGIQHHYAHVLSCMLENELEPPVLGVCWDGTGYGGDGTIWGGEFLSLNDRSFDRIAHLRHFRLPGGEAAIRQPRRAALGLLFELFGGDAAKRLELPLFEHFSRAEQTMLERMLANRIHSPLTSSAGRLFDAVSALTGIRQKVSFEGQAAMELEHAIQSAIDDSYDFNLKEGQPLILDWKPLILAIIEDLHQGVASGVVAAKFHNTLAEMIVRVARRLRENAVVLTGGCFQNKYLTERAVLRLREEGFQPYWHRRIPPNDGGIAPGQIVGALREGERQLHVHRNGKEENVFGNSR
jgi:hydrogenase maturation protein HypF